MPGPTPYRRGLHDGYTGHPRHPDLTCDPEYDRGYAEGVAIAARSVRRVA